MKAIICDICKEVTTKPESVRYSIGKQKGKRELCETCNRKLLDFLDGKITQTVSTNMLTLKTQSVKTQEKPDIKPVMPEPQSIKPQPAPEKPKEPIKILKDLAATIMPTTVKGFLYVKCPTCGETRGFNAKTEINRYHCNTCNTESDLISLVPVYSKCECGRSWKYMTNITDEMFDIPCLDCGNPVAVSWNANTGAYETIRVVRHG